MWSARVKTGSRWIFYCASSARAGHYTVTCEAQDSRDADFHDIVVRVTETTRLIAKLRAAQPCNRQVEVQAVVQQVDTTDATTGQAIEAETIRSSAAGDAEFPAVAYAF